MLSKLLFPSSSTIIGDLFAASSELEKSNPIAAYRIKTLGRVLYDDSGLIDSVEAGMNAKTLETLDSIIAEQR